MKISIQKRYELWLGTDQEGHSKDPTYNCIFIDPDGWAVVSDGLMMAVAPYTVEDMPEGFEGVMLPPGFYHQVWEATLPGTPVSFEWDAGLHRFMGEGADGIRLACNQVEGKYPKWRNLFEVYIDKEQGEYGRISLNPLLVEKMAATLGCTVVNLCFRTPQSPVLFKMEGDGVGGRDPIGLLMPMFIDFAAINTAGEATLAAILRPFKEEVPA